MAGNIVNATSRRAGVTIVRCSECVCSMLPSMQYACAELNCHLWPARLYHIFPHYLKHGTIFGKKAINTKCVF
jgi:hypothetical protein